MRVNSTIRFFPTKDSKDYCIEASAYFEVEDENSIIDMRTPYTITDLKINGFQMDNIRGVAEFIRTDYFELKRQIHAKFVDYADTLPF